MNRVYRYLLVIALFVALPFVALAQQTDVNIDFNSIFASTASLAVIVAVCVELIRKHLWTALDGGMVVVAAIVVGAALAVVGYYTGYLAAPSLASALAFGVAAGAMASGGKGVLSSISAKTEAK